MNDSKSPRKSRVSAHIQVIPKSGIREFFDIVVKMKDVISLGVGEPDFITPWHIREQSIFGIEKGHTAYTANAGKLTLRKEICSYVEKNFKVSYEPEGECLVTVGVSEALDLLFRAILTPGDEVIYHEPSFVSYPAEIAFAHGVPVAIPTYAENDFNFSEVQLRSKITSKTKAILINSPCNPTGAVFSLETLQMIARVAIEYDLLVISDEIYSELTYVERNDAIASFENMKDRTIFLHGFSKAFAMTGFRVGFACGPHDIIDAMTKIHQYAIMCANTSAQEAAEEALKNGEEAMKKMRQEYLMRRNFVVNALNEMGLPTRMPQGAFYVFPSIHKLGVTDREFAMGLLEEKKIAVVPGRAFGSSGEGYIRCSYATSMEKLKLAMKRMADYVQMLKEKQTHTNGNNT